MMKACFPHRPSDGRAVLSERQIYRDKVSFWAEYYDTRLKDRKSDAKKGGAYKRASKRNGREKGMDCKLDLSRSTALS